MLARIWLFMVGISVASASAVAQQADSPPKVVRRPEMETYYGDAVMKLLAVLAVDGDIRSMEDELRDVRDALETFFAVQVENLRKLGVDDCYFAQVARDLRKILAYYDDCAARQDQAAFRQGRPRRQAERR